MKVLDDPKRRSIRRKLAPVIGDDDAENLVSALPSEDDDIVTEQFLRAELSEQSVKLEDKFATKEFLRAELAERFQKQTAWTCSTFVAGIVALAAVMKFF